MARRYRWLPLALIAALLPLSACDAPTEQRNADEGVLEIVPKDVEFTAIGDSVRLIAELLTPTGQRSKLGSYESFEWISSDPTIATILPNGFVLARGAGRVIIVGKWRGRKDSVTVKVKQVPDRVTVRPDEAVLAEIGATSQLTAQVLDKKGVEIPGATVTWQSSDKSIVSVDSSGLLTARGAGEAEVVASFRGAKSGKARVRVNQPKPGRVTIVPDSLTISVGQVKQLGAQVTDGNGKPVNDPKLQWLSLNPQVASIDSMGTLTARKAGIALITLSAVCCSADTATVVVEQTPNSIEVSPASGTLTALGDTIHLSARALDANGTPVPGVSVSWKSANGAIADVNSRGVVTARGVGQAKIIATADGLKPDTVVIDVEQLPTAVAITPDTLTLAIGATHRLSAGATDANGSAIADPEIAWKSLNPEIAGVDSLGRVTARAAGVALITASAVCCTASDTARINVARDTTEAPAAERPERVTDLTVADVGTDKVTLTWRAVSDGAGGVAKYALRYGSPAITWAGAYHTEQVVEAGRVREVVTYTLPELEEGTQYEFQLVSYRGTLNEDAVFGDLSNIARISTKPAPPETDEPVVRSITVSPDRHTFTAIGQTFKLSATAFDGNGKVIEGVEFTWSSNNSSIVSVDRMGVATARGVGTALIAVSVACCAEGVTAEFVVTQDEKPSTAEPLYATSFEEFQAGRDRKINGGGANGFRWTTDAWADVSTDRARTGTKSLKFRYSENPSFAEQRYSHPPVQEIWIEYYLWIPEGYHHIDGNQKLASWWGPAGYGRTGNGVFQYWPDGDGTSYANVARYGPESDSPTERYVGSSGRGSRFFSSEIGGTWQRIRYHIKLADFGASNGIFRLWRGDTLFVNVTNDKNHASRPEWNVLTSGYLLGWMNGSLRGHPDLYIDDFKFYTSNPGW